MHRLLYRVTLKAEQSKQLVCGTCTKSLNMSNSQFDLKSAQRSSGFRIEEAKQVYL